MLVDDGFYQFDPNLTHFMKLCLIRRCAGDIYFCDVISLLQMRPAEHDRYGNEKPRKPVQSVRNFEIVLENDVRFAKKIRFDEFSRQVFLTGATEWEAKQNFRAWSNNDDSSENVMSDIKQAWAEAVHIYKTDCPKLVLPDEVAEEARRLQESSMCDDGMRGLIEEFLRDKTQTCAIQIWQEALGEMNRPPKWKAGEINNIIDSLDDWERMKTPRVFPIYGSQRGFRKKTTTTIKDSEKIKWEKFVVPDFMPIRAEDTPFK